MSEDSRQNFVDSWLKLYEMPAGTADINIYNILLYSLEDRLEFGTTTISCGNNLFKTTGAYTIYYWIEKQGIKQIIAEITITAQNYTVNAVAKRQAGGAPYASDFYIDILNDITDDTKQSIRFQSDKIMTQAGLSIWQRLIDNGYAISVYDNQNPGQSMQSLLTRQDLLNFFQKNDRSFQRYQYVLSHPGNYLAEVRAVFNTRRMRELCGTL